MEMEELSKSRGSESLFTTAGADTFPARRSREQFERFFVPSFTIAVIPAPGGWGLVAVEEAGADAGHRDGARDAGHGLVGADGAAALFAGQILQPGWPGCKG